MKFILREVCKKYKEKGDPTFNSDEISEGLRGLGPGYVDLNIKETWTQSRFVDIDENYNFTLNEEGKKACKRGELDWVYTYFRPSIAFSIRPCRNACRFHIFQKACGVRRFGSPHFLHVYTTIEVKFRKYLINDIDKSTWYWGDLESYDGVNKVESFITTGLTIYQGLVKEWDWQKNQSTVLIIISSGNNKRGIIYISCILRKDPLFCV